MGEDDQQPGGRRGKKTATRGRSVSRGRGKTTSAGTEAVTVSHSESRSAGCGHPEDYRTVRLAWARPTPANSRELRERVLTELARLLAEVPEAVTIDQAAVRGQDFLFTLAVPRARLQEVCGTAGTSEQPYLVLTPEAKASKA